jgi:hypothetical protein
MTDPGEILTEAQAAELAQGQEHGDLDMDIETSADERSAQSDRLMRWLGAERDRLFIELRDANAELALLRAQRDAALKLHHRTEVEGHFGACATQDCDHEDECPLVMIGVCNACFYHVAPLYEDDDQPWTPDVIWPCPTAAALGVQPEGS